jgi:predicted MFS family arabinose efflux permease
VARFGEQRVLQVNYTVLTFVFLCYAVIPQLEAINRLSIEVPGLSLGRWVLYPSFPATPGLLILLVIFVIDRTMMGFSIAVESYMQKIALAPEEITGNVALGQTINHIAAVIVPVAGGVMWEVLGSRYTFIAGMAIVLAALALTTRMRAPQSRLGKAGVMAQE